MSETSKTTSHIKCDDVWSKMNILQSELASTTLITHDWMGSLFEVLTKDTRKYLVRIPKFPINQAELDTIIKEVPSEFFLTNIKLTEAGALVTEVSGMDSLHGLNQQGPMDLFVPVEETEAAGIVNRVSKILLKAEELKLDTFDVSPHKLYCRKIPGVTPRMIIKRTANYEMWLAEPYMHLALVRLQRPDPAPIYYDKLYHDPYNKRKLSFSLGNLMYYLIYGVPHDDYYNECKALSYSYTRYQFQLMKSRLEERSSINDVSRTFEPMYSDAPLILYPSIYVENYLTSKGIYSGTLRYGVIHGYGEMEITKSFGLFSDVKHYRGYFVSEKMHLHGEIVYRNSEKYIGYISWEIPWGRGAMTNINGVVREGNFEGSALIEDDSSIIRYTDGRSIQGPTVKGVANGKCIETLADGTVYEGEFKMGRKHGHFTAKRYHPEDKYFLVMSFDGEYFDDKKHGKVKEFEYESYEFEGNYEHGKKTGVVNWKVHDKFEYQGEVLNDKFHGNGILKTTHWTGVDTYEGGFEAGQCHGLGKLVTGSGKEYEGTWVNGVKSGEFRVLTEDWIEKVVLFVDGYEMEDEM